MQLRPTIAAEAKGAEPPEKWSGRAQSWLFDRVIFISESPRFSFGLPYKEAQKVSHWRRGKKCKDRSNCDIDTESFEFEAMTYDFKARYQPRLAH